jgi:hypothetical protein
MLVSALPQLSAGSVSGSSYLVGACETHWSSRILTRLEPIPCITSLRSTIVGVGMSASQPSSQDQDVPAVVGEPLSSQVHSDDKRGGRGQRRLKLLRWHDVSSGAVTPAATERWFPRYLAALRRKTRP